MHLCHIRGRDKKKELNRKGYRTLQSAQHAVPLLLYGWCPLTCARSTDTPAVEQLPSHGILVRPLRLNLSLTWARSGAATTTY
eukprot:2928072-Pyramimonas_sp.AAC.1